MANTKASTSKPFDLLLKDFENNKEVKVADLDFKFLSRNNPTGRVLERVSLQGYAVVYSETGELITKAVLRNISLGGIGIEIPPINISTGTQLRVLLTGEALNLGSIHCEVKWVAVLEGKAPANKIIGLEINNDSEQFRKSFNKYVNEKLRLSTPFKNRTNGRS